MYGGVDVGGRWVKGRSGRGRRRGSGKCGREGGMCRGVGWKEEEG